jgi:hypothetical protein
MHFGQQRRQICRVFALALPAGMLAVLAGCRAPAPRAEAPGGTPASVAQPADDSLYDWHRLVIAPFGSMLKDISGLHEVLLFHDDAHGGGAADDAECYSTDAPAPLFVGRVPDEYLLCFKRDRLSRIQASVHLPADEGPATYAAACGAWLRHSVPAGEPHDGAGCDGLDGNIRFGGRLGDETGLSLTLDGVSEP